MKNQLSNSEAVHAFEFIQENVIDTTGQQDVTKCPSCSKQAVERTFDECLGGCINQVSSIDCPHCNYHECDQEFCSICDAELQSSSDENSYLLDSIQRADLILDYLIDELAEKKHVKATDITELKLLLVSNSAVSELFSSIFVPKGTTTLHYIQRKLLDANFGRNLALKIMLAKAS
ncbi:hypothetical protein AB6E94_18960 [Vibrio lentus]|uniref:hypothetical protein n=1 Tax=Vibrio TaxID=662 RepID=UPI000C854144|nr:MULTISPECIES: hypothetical protein [Vibrio]MCC4838129.1 hypothetical protein [Vibrio lentus]PMG17784.1 hypothetical protein BCU98_00180 [Vibrio splendidus]